LEPIQKQSNGNERNWNGRNELFLFRPETVLSLQLMGTKQVAISFRFIIHAKINHKIFFLSESLKRIFFQSVLIEIRQKLSAFSLNGLNYLFSFLFLRSVETIWQFLSKYIFLRILLLSYRGS